jgi:hypothetical protein
VNTLCWWQAAADERQKPERETLRALLNGRNCLTPNRSTGRIEGELWEAFPAQCQRRGVSPPTACG